MDNLTEGLVLSPEREAFDAWFAAATFETLGEDWNRSAWQAGAAFERGLCAGVRTALEEIRDRIKDHPVYAELTEAEEMATGGDTAEFSYLVRVADEALGDDGRTT